MRPFLTLLILFLMAAVLFAQESARDQVIVKFKIDPHSSEAIRVQQQLGLTKISEIQPLHVVTYKIKKGESLTTVISRLKKYEFIAYAEPDYVNHTQKVNSINMQAGSPAPADTAGKKQVIRKAKPFYQTTSIQYVPGRILVKFKQQITTEAVATTIKQLGIQVKETISPLAIEVCQTTPEKTVESVLAALSGNPNIAYAEPDYIVHALEVPNDPKFGNLWGLNNEGQTGGTYDADIDAPEAWNVEKGKKDIIVSIIDTGIDYQHPDLRKNMWTNPGEIPGNGIDDDNNGFVDDYRGWDFANNDADPIDDNDHGTHVAGTIGAVGNNNVGVVGVNWQVQLMPLKFLNASGSGSTSDAIKAIIYAADNGAKILSNSWGGGGSSTALKEAIEYADQKGALFIAAAGNESNDNDVKPNYPSNYEVENVIAVAATDDRDMMADFSNYGKTTVDLAAPGVDIYSTIADNGYAYFSGTSMATPHVSGVAALIWAHYLQKADQNFVKYRLFGAVDNVRNLEGVVLLGGRLNANNAFTDHPLIAVIEKPGDTDDTSGPYPVKTAVVDEDTVMSVRLVYMVTNGSTRTDTLRMLPGRPYVFQAAIPGAGAGSQIEYKVLATDNDGHQAESRFFSFKIGKKPGGCCGTFAATIDTGEPVTSASASLIVNVLLLFGMPYLVVKRFFGKSS